MEFEIKEPKRQYALHDSKPYYNRKKSRQYPSAGRLLYHRFCQPLVYRVQKSTEYDRKP